MINKYDINDISSIVERMLFDHYIKVRERYIKRFGNNERFTYLFNVKHKR